MKYALLILWLLMTCSLLAQISISARNEIIDKVISSVENTNNGNIDYNEIVERLEQFLTTPLNLNTATESDLKELFFLNETQIYNLLVYRLTYNHLSTIYELRLIPSFDSETIRNILPFVFVGTTTLRDSIQKKSNVKHDILIRYQRVEQKPYPNYEGSLDKYYFKYKLNIDNKYLVGFVADKDAGEPFFRGCNQQGFDFYSGYLQFNNLGVIKKIIVGDFNMEIGQGLNLWSSVSFGRSSSDVSLWKSARGLASKTSSAESSFFRGIAAQMRIGNVEIMPFLSYRNIDATVSRYDSQGNPLEMTAIYKDGYHRTESEIRRKRAVAEFVTGCRVGYSNRRLTLGFTGYYMHLEAALNPANRIDNKNVFRGRENLNLGIDYTFLFMNNAIYGEVAMSKNGGIGIVSGININPHSIISMTVLGRYYQDKYQNLFSNAVSQYSGTRNESGVYMGMRVQLLDRLYAMAYGDIYQSLSHSYYTYSNVLGQEYMASLNYDVSDRVSMQLKYLYKNRGSDVNIDSAKVVRTLYVPQNRISLRVYYKTNDRLEFDNTVSFNSNKIPDDKTNKGILLNCSGSYLMRKPNMKVTLAYMLFDTDSYNERIYCYENDILYGNSFNFYNGEGSRYYLLISYRIMKQLQIWVKWSQTFMHDKHLLESNPISEIKLQLQVKL